MSERRLSLEQIQAFQEYLFLDEKSSVNGYSGLRVLFVSVLF